MEDENLEPPAQQQQPPLGEEKKAEPDCQETEEKDEHYIEGLWGTLAPQQDEAHYDVRSDADDDMEKGRLKFPRNNSPIMASSNSENFNDSCNSITAEYDTATGFATDYEHCMIQNNDRRRLYGRQEELEQLNDIFSGIADGMETYSPSHHDSLSASMNSSLHMSSFGLENSVSLGGSISSTMDSSARLGADNNAPSWKSSRSKVVFLSGHSGVGKSALIEEFVQSLSDSMPEHIFYASGAFHFQTTQERFSINRFSSQSMEAAPFSTISQAFGKAVQGLTRLKSNTLNSRKTVRKSISLEAMQTIMEHAGSLRSITDNVKEDTQPSCSSAAGIDDSLEASSHFNNKVIGNGFLKVPSSIARGSLGRAVLREVFPSINAYLNVIECAMLQDLPEIPEVSQGVRDTDEEVEDDRSDLEEDCNEEDPSDSQNQLLNIEGIKVVLREFFSLLAKTMAKPIVIFIDDMQWADGPSLELLHFLACDKRVRNVMFIFTYRTNLVTEDHPLQSFIDSVKSSRSSNNRGRVGWRSSSYADTGVMRFKTSHKVPSGVEDVELSPLSSEVIRSFVADTLSKSPEEVDLLSDIIYQLTMGNMFYVIHAMEEMVSNNALYFDIMTYEWRWNDSKLDADRYHIGDVADLIKAKIGRLSNEMRALLTVMAFIPQPLHTATIQSLLSGEGFSLDEARIMKLVDQALEEGMLFHNEMMDNYCIANSQIREVVSSMVPIGETQYELLVRISKVLQSRMSNKTRNNWMRYVVVDLLNSVPPSYTDQVELVKLNLSAGKFAWNENSMESACEIWRSGMSCLDASNNKWKEYDITLDLCNHVITGEYLLGNYDIAKTVIQDVLTNAKSKDMFVAQKHNILCTVANDKTQYKAGINESIELLKMHGVNVSFKPKPLRRMSDTQFFKKSISFMTELPTAENNCLLELLAIVSEYALETSSEHVLLSITRAAIEKATKNGVNQFLPEILLNYAIFTLEKDATLQRLTRARAFGETAMEIAKRFEKDAGRYAAAHSRFYSYVLSFVIPFHEVCGKLKTTLLDLKVSGSKALALDCGLNYFNAYIAAGLPLNPRFESQLVLMEEYSRSTNHMELSYRTQILLKFYSGLKKSKTSGAGFIQLDSFDESSEEKSKSDVMRDAKMYQLQHFFIFGEEQGVIDSLHETHDFQLEGGSPAMMHNRLCFLGLAAYSARNKTSKYLKAGKKCEKYFEDLKKLGSQNAYPICLLLEAFKTSSSLAFDKAIKACAVSKMLHLQALACEHYGILLKKKGDELAYEEYISKSYDLYKEWRASAKAHTMMKTYDFLSAKKCK